MNPWVLFVVSAAAIIVAGHKLSRYGDEIADLTGLGRAWIGAILLAGVTSLPEVVSSVVAASHGWGNLAMGNVFGSNILNLAIIALAQLFAVRPILANVSRSHTMVATAGMLLSGIAAMAMLVRIKLSVTGVGLDVWLILLTYLLILRLLPRGEEGAPAPEPEPSAQAGPRRSPSGTWLRFALAAGTVVFAGWFLTGAAEAIARMTGLGQTFVGTTLLALATSLPELVVTIVSVRRGAYDLAVGNVLGSNIFNMLILFFSDLAMPGPVPILSTATGGQVLAAVLGLVLSGIALLGLVTPRQQNRPAFQWDSRALAAGYLVGTWFLYAMR